MQDAGLVRGLHAVQHLIQQGGGEPRRKPAGAIELSAPRHALRVLHHEVRRLARHAEVIHADDVRVLEAAAGLRFTGEPALHSAAAERRRSNHLGRDPPIQPETVAS